MAIKHNTLGVVCSTRVVAEAQHVPSQARDSTAPLMTDGSTVWFVVPTREGSQSQEIGVTFISDFSANQTSNGLHNHSVKHYGVGPANMAPVVTLDRARIT